MLTQMLAQVNHRQITQATPRSRELDELLKELKDLEVAVEPKTK